MSDEIDALIHGYLDETLPQDQIVQLNAWIKASPANAARFAATAWLHNRLRDVLRSKQATEPAGHLTPLCPDADDPGPKETPAHRKRTVPDPSDTRMSRIERPTEPSLASPPRLPGSGNDASISGWVPPLPPTIGLPTPARPPAELRPGDKLGKYTIKRRIGRGGLATVYLAEQPSLEREVALKVSPNRGSEGRTMATLKHRNIVEVYDEDPDSIPGCRLLCMEVVRGAALDEILHLLQARGANWTGKDLLEAVEQLAPLEGRFDPQALAERTELERCNRAETACWLIRQLAEALAHAHHHGVIHRDIKPGNILIDQYGRVKLADFNISLDPQRRAGARGEIFGGTLDYMAPEHLDAFNPASGVGPEAVEPRSDLYAVGLLFYELLTGEMPFASSKSHASSPETLAQLAGERRGICRARVRARIPDEGLASVILRCLEPNPDQRFADATKLSRAVSDCLERQHVRGSLPPLGSVGEWVARFPAVGLILLAYVPNLIGTVVNIGYNKYRIVADLPLEQQVLFDRLWIVYNALAHPVGIGLMLWLVWPWLRLAQARAEQQPIEQGRLDQMRRRVLSWPNWTALFTCLAWFPGALFFPLALHVFGGGVTAMIFIQFAFSFTLSALIALTYAVLGVRFAVLRIFYPDLLIQTPGGLAETTRHELPPPGGNWLTLLAGLIPLSAAALLAGLVTLTDPFRILLIALIVLGMVGVWIAAGIQAYLDRTLLALRRQTAEGYSPVEATKT